MDLERKGYRAVVDLPITAAGMVVHLKGVGPIRVFKAVSQDGDVEYWATNDLAMDELRRLELAERCWSVEEYHRALSNAATSSAIVSSIQRNTDRVTLLSYKVEIASLNNSTRLKGHSEV